MLRDLQPHEEVESMMLDTSRGTSDKVANGLPVDQYGMGPQWPKTLFGSKSLHTRAGIVRRPLLCDNNGRESKGPKDSAWCILDTCLVINESLDPLEHLPNLCIFDTCLVINRSIHAHIYASWKLKPCVKEPSNNLFDFFMKFALVNC